MSLSEEANCLETVAAPTEIAAALSAPSTCCVKRIHTLGAALGFSSPPADFFARDFFAGEIVRPAAVHAAFTWVSSASRRAIDDRISAAAALVSMMLDI